MSFSDSRLHPSLLRGVADLGFTQPTQIQRDAIPPGLDGRDVLACAMTGSGKTAAFLLPMMQRLLGKKPGTTRALVITPTRELASQIVEHFNALAKHTRLRAAAVYGGVGYGPQERAFRQGVDLIVACPGRLLDHFRQPYARLSGLEVLVLDEADRMLDMGFLPDIRRVLQHLPRIDQTMLFSATMPAPIVKLSRDLLRDPVRLDVERPPAPATGVTQTVFPIRQNLKSRLLHELLERDEIGNVLVFTRTKHRANRLAQFLGKRGVSCDRIHGNRTQGQRTRALADFKNGKTRVLVATDIAARGIDVEALSHVVNFDVPHVPDDYIHRVGRTARAQAVGEAFTFVSPQEKGGLRAIERAVGKRLPQRTLEGFDAGDPGEELEIPIGARMAAHRARKASDRQRSRTNAGRPAGGRGPRRRRARRPRRGPSACPARG
ncbi:MAG: DEAD/DEAH box helicase [bacterium]|nr:DEAD/DEAH box helicase [bacterium]